MTVMFLMDRLNIYDTLQLSIQKPRSSKHKRYSAVCMYPESTTRHTSIEALLQAKLNLSESTTIDTNILVLVLVSV
jgi:hypothetical protein